MFINRFLKSVSPRKSKRGGFTLVELLVVIGIIAILAGVALGPITAGIEKAKENAAMQSARTITVAAFQYSNDNQQTYPTGATSEAMAIVLLNGKYVSDPAIFSLQSSSKYTGTSDYSSNFQSGNIDWDFFSPITSSSSDLLPVVFSHTTVTGLTPTAGTALSITLNGGGPFKKNGVAVAYKGNNATFIKGQTSGTTVTCPNFISASYDDTTSYTQIVP